MNAPQDDKPALAVVHRVRMLLPVPRAGGLWADGDGARVSAAMPFDGSFSLVSEYEKTYPLNPRMNSSSRSTVKIKELSLDHRIEKSTESYKDSSLIVHELWQLKMETDSHDLDVKGESNSEILGPDTDYGYLITLTFPTEEAAEAAWAQIREIRYLVK